MKSFFNEYEALTEDGLEICKSVSEALHPILKKYQEKGYPVREIESIMIENVIYDSALLILVEATKKRTAKRAQDGIN